MRTLLPALIAVVSLLAAPSGVGSVPVWRTFYNARLGNTLQLPSGWRASVGPADGVTVVTSLVLPNRNDNPERITLSRGGAYFWIFDYGRVRGSFPRRPDRIRLGRERMHTCGFGMGYGMTFSDHGRLLQVFVKLAPRADRGVVLAVLNSLRVTV